MRAIRLQSIIVGFFRWKFFYLQTLQSVYCWTQNCKGFHLIPHMIYQNLKKKRQCHSLTLFSYLWYLLWGIKWKPFQFCVQQYIHWKVWRQKDFCLENPITMDRNRLASRNYSRSYHLLQILSKPFPLTDWL